MPPTPAWRAADHHAITNQALKTTPATLIKEPPRLIRQPQGGGPSARCRVHFGVKSVSGDANEPSIFDAPQGIAIRQRPGNRRRGIKLTIPGRRLRCGPTPKRRPFGVVWMGVPSLQRGASPQSTRMGTHRIERRVWWAWGATEEPEIALPCPNTAGFCGPRVPVEVPCQ